MTLGSFLGLECAKSGLLQAGNVEICNRKWLEGKPLQWLTRNDDTEAIGC